MKGIILHGGSGTRLRPLTYTGPKQLLMIANKPMSQYALESIRDAGIKEIAIIIGDTYPEKVKEYYGDGSKFGVKITYVFQDEPKGISHAIGLCKDFIGSDKFIVFLGDNVLLKNMSNYVTDFSNSDDEAKIFLCEVDNPSQFGVIELTKDGKISKIVEKPKIPPTNLAIIGIYFLSPSIFDVIKNLKPSWRNELEITDALQLLFESKKKISYDVITNYWKDTGTPLDIIDANKMILSQMKSYFYGIKENNVSINGNVMVGKNTIIQNGAQIKGPVIIGENCKISGSVRLGPNVSVGNNSTLNDCTISDSIIMHSCNIDCKLNIAQSILANNSSITSNEEKKSIFLLCEDSKIIL